MPCNNNCKLCDKFIMSTAVNYDSTANAVIINIPADTYRDKCKYCLVIAQTIPVSARINSPVFISIGGGTTRYPLVKKNCAQVTVCGIRNRTKYSTIVNTNATGGVFKLLGNTCCEPNNNLTGLTESPVTA